MIRIIMLKKIINAKIGLSSIRRTMSSREADNVLFKTINDVGIITLNRPKALNAVNLSMLQKILQKLQQWENEKELVILKGNGDKIFCAGGDAKDTITAKNEGSPLSNAIFGAQYTIDNVIGNYKIPHIAIMDGITMGAGVGMSMHGRYKIATENTIIAMPETKIGHFPDAGGSYFLPRLQSNLGIYLGLTGARLKGKDVLKAGMATHYIPSNRLHELEKLLVECTNENEIRISLSKFNEPHGDFSLAAQLKDIKYCFAASSVEEIKNRLKQVNTDWSKVTLKILSEMSPTSLKISLRAMQRGARLELWQCMQMEYRISTRILKGHDLAQGVCSLLIDKNNKPKWKPATLEEVDDAYVESHFEKLPPEEELKLQKPSKL